jgi:hypothetical protein
MGSRRSDPGCEETLSGLELPRLIFCLLRCRSGRASVIELLVECDLL